MSTSEVIARLEAERAGIEEKMNGLREREQFLGQMIDELRKTGGGGGGRAARRGPGRPKGSGRKAAGGAPAAEGGAAAKPKGRRGRKPKGGMSLRDAILKAITDAGEPLTPSDIVATAAKLSGGKPISIRTQITPLAQQGVLTKHEHEGRGFKYGVAGMDGKKK